MYDSDLFEERMGSDWKEKEDEEKSKRQIVDEILNIAIKINEKSASLDKHLDNEHLPLLKTLLSHSTLLSVLKNIRYYRNDINHAGWKPDLLLSGKFCEKFDEWFPLFRSSLLAFWTDGNLDEKENDHKGSHISVEG